MYLKTVKLTEISNLVTGKEATLSIYLCSESKEIPHRGRPALLILPGGGYSFCSDREAEPVALRFMSEGFNCFVLRYTCAKPYPLPQKEVAIAMKYIHDHHQQFNLRPFCTSIVGFSAGGHLAASYGLLYAHFAKEFKADELILRPFSLVLSYPVITMKKYAHSGTAQVITDNFKPDLVNLLSVEKNVTPIYPPTYIWTTKTDTCVPPENSLMLVEKFKKENILHRFDLFDDGWHGGSLCNRGVYSEDIDISHCHANQIWVNNAVDFIYSLLKH
ncbi:MAG: alpha/beta hydrolase [Bacilli bacterium]|jgi:acetyl esterase/lipase